MGGKGRLCRGGDTCAWPGRTKGGGKRAALDIASVQAPRLGARQEANSWSQGVCACPGGHLGGCWPPMLVVSPLSKPAGTQSGWHHPCCDAKLISCMERAWLPSLLLCGTRRKLALGRVQAGTCAGCLSALAAATPAGHGREPGWHLL